MPNIFPDPITNLPQADIPLNGIQAYLSQSTGHQIVFMDFSEDVELPEHNHAGQWGIVVNGKIDLFIAGVKHTFSKGDSYYIPEGVNHAAKIYAGYADVTFFNQENRYKVK